MMVSGAVAVTISAAPPPAPRAVVGFAVLTLVLLYALVENIIEKPDGIAISLAVHRRASSSVSLVSRVARTTELRADADRVRRDGPRGSSPTRSPTTASCNIIANRRQAGDARRVRGTRSSSSAA